MRLPPAAGVPLLCGFQSDKDSRPGKTLVDIFLPRLVGGEFHQIGRLQKIPQPLVRLAVEGVCPADFAQKFFGGLLGTRMPVVRSM